MAGRADHDIVEAVRVEVAGIGQRRAEALAGGAVVDAQELPSWSERKAPARLQRRWKVLEKSSAG